MAGSKTLRQLEQNDDFIHRHIGPSQGDIDGMLEALGFKSLDALIEKAVPKVIRSDTPLALPKAAASVT